MKAFIGVILNMGFIQLSQLKDYWMTHETINLQFFRRVTAVSTAINVRYMKSYITIIRFNMREHMIYNNIHDQYRQGFFDQYRQVLTNIG